MNYKYGEFSDNQVAELKKYIRKQIFFLLLIVDPKTKKDYENINVEKTFKDILTKIAGLNSLLFCPDELPRVMMMLEAALREYKSESFDFSVYRKLILDSGAEVNRIKGV